MEQRTIWLSAAECRFLAFTLPADALWPPNETLASALLSEVPGGEAGGGPRLRAVVLAMALKEDEEELPLELKPGELWLIDWLLLSRDLRSEKLPDGEPLLTLASKVWRLLLDIYDDQLPPNLRREVLHGSPNDPDQDTDADADDAVASAEALLRSRDRAGAEGDLPPAAA
jgi:hypothetical protein